ncbi:MAG: cyclic nucleotide-binding domain-containing protein [Rhizobiaceae bacterium]
MRPDELPRIRELPLFSSMSEENFLDLTTAAYLQHFPPQVELIVEGDSADFLYVVVEGTVELFAKSNGRETTMAIVRPVNTFILAAVLKDAVYLMSARTVERSRLLMIPTSNVRTAFENDPKFARSIVSELAGCYRAVVKDHKNLKLRSSVERLANRLIKYHTEQGANGTVELFHDKRTLAALLGMTPENLSRAFNTLKPYGVEVNGTSIHLTDLPALETLAKPNQLIDDRTV